MHEPTHTDDPAAAQPRPRKPRRRRPQGRFSNPATPLQAARFARRETGKEVVAAIRKLCPGHGRETCKIDLTKLSDYENKRRRPSIEHIEAFCRYYQMSAEDLGLITWRDQPTRQPDAAAPTTPNPLPGQDDPHPTHEQLVMDWLCDSVTAVATTLVRALLRCPIKLTREELHHLIKEDHSEADLADPPCTSTEPSEHQHPPPARKDDASNSPPSDVPAPASQTPPSPPPASTATPDLPTGGV